jgi:hypothetical protein
MDRNCALQSVPIVAVLLLAPVSARADKGGTPRNEAVHPLFGFANRTDGPFPADRFTVADPAQNTCERVNLPVGVCEARPDQPSTCYEIQLLNQLEPGRRRPAVRDARERYPARFWLFH